MRNRVAQKIENSTVRLIRLQVQGRDKCSVRRAGCLIRLQRRAHIFTKVRQEFQYVWRKIAKLLFLFKSRFIEATPAVRRARDLSPAEIRQSFVVP